MFKFKTTKALNTAARLFLAALVSLACPWLAVEMGEWAARGR